MTWNDAYLEGRVLSADPLELICLVYQHAIDMVHDAREHLAEGDIAGRSRAVSRAIAAISELDAALDRSAGGELSQNLANLYEYMRRRLTEANLRQEDEPLREVSGLLATLADAWNANRQQASAPRPAPEAGFFPPHASVFEDAAVSGHDWSA